MYNMIDPSAYKILGSSQGTANCPQAPLPAVPKADSKPSLWTRFKRKAKRVLNTVREGLLFAKDVIVPVVTATAALFNSWNHFRQRRWPQEDRRCYSWIY